MEMDIQLNEYLPFLKLTGALLIGIVIGWEREQRENIPAMRLLPLVSVGATLYTLYSGVDGNRLENPQLAGGVVTGVGFLCAGMIARRFGSLTGVTTAATVWVTAALGIGIGIGLYLQVFLVTGAVLAILWYFPRLSRSSNHTLGYEIVAPYDEARFDEYCGRFKEHEIEILRSSLSRNRDQMSCIWYTNGNLENHQKLTLIFANDRTITDLNTKLA